MSHHRLSKLCSAHRLATCPGKDPHSCLPQDRLAAQLKSAIHWGRRVLRVVVEGCNRDFDRFGIGVIRRLGCAARHVAKGEDYRGGRTPSTTMTSRSSIIVNPASWFAASCFLRDSETCVITPLRSSADRGRHSLALVRRHDVQQLVRLPLTDQVPHPVIGNEHLARSDPSTTDLGDQTLSDDRPEGCG